MSHHDRPATQEDAPRYGWEAEVGGVRVAFGEGRIEELGRLARRFDSRRVLVVSDPGLVAVGHADRALDSLRRARLGAVLFDGAVENPTTHEVEAGVRVARRHNIDLLVGLGGGSALDCAKGINFIYTNGGRMEDYWGEGKARHDMLPSIGIPTTTGTGSEAQSFALITQPSTHRKMACGDRKARFRTVILDPELVGSQPPGVAAAASVDALSHAIESYVTQRRNPLSQLYAREAWRLIERSLEPFLADPETPGAGAAMLWGAHLAGASIEASMLGAAHSCANPLTARFGITHGIAVGLMLPHVVKFNGNAVDDLYAELVSAASLNGKGNFKATTRLSRRLLELGKAADLPKGLGACGVDEESLEALADEAADQWTARFNPRPVTANDLRGLYEAAF